MNKKIKKTLIGCGAISSVVIPIIAVVSCGENSNHEKDGWYRATDGHDYYVDGGVAHKDTKDGTEYYINDTPKQGMGVHSISVGAEWGIGLGIGIGLPILFLLFGISGHSSNKKNTTNEKQIYEYENEFEKINDYKEKKCNFCKKELPKNRVGYKDDVLIENYKEVQYVGTYGTTYDLIYCIDCFNENGEK